MEENETYFPVSRGFLEHLREITGDSCRLYLWLLGKAKFRPPNKGRVLTKAFIIGDWFGWKKTKVYATLKHLEKKYISIKRPKSRHGFLVIDILRFKAVPDFYRPSPPEGNPDGNADGNPDGNPTVTPAKSLPDNAPRTPNKERRKEVKKESSAGGVREVFRGTYFTLDSNDLQIFAQAYPGLEFDPIFKKMDAWLHTHAARRPKTKNGVLTFVNGWLSGDHNAQAAPAEFGKALADLSTKKSIRNMGRGESLHEKKLRFLGRK